MVWSVCAVSFAARKIAISTHGRPLSYLTPTPFNHSVDPGQMVTMGFMLQSASAEGVKVTGDVKVVDAEFCDRDG